MDHTAGDQRVFESGAILWYLAEKEDKEGKFWPKVIPRTQQISKQVPDDTSIHYWQCHCLQGAALSAHNKCGRFMIHNSQCAGLWEAGRGHELAHVPNGTPLTKQHQRLPDRQRFDCCNTMHHGQTMWLCCRGVWDPCRAKPTTL